MPSQNSRHSVLLSCNTFVPSTLKYGNALQRLFCFFSIFLRNQQASLSNKHAILVSANTVQFNSYASATVRKDAIDLHATLTSSFHNFGFLPWNVTLLTDKAATRENVIQAFQALPNVKHDESSLFVFYYTGHGAQNPTFGLCFGNSTKEWLLSEELSNLLKSVPFANKLAILDCCHAGGIGDAKSMPQKEEQAKQQTIDTFNEKMATISDDSGTCLITSSSVTEASAVAWNNSAFSYHMMHALLRIPECPAKQKNCAHCDTYVKMCALNKAIRVDPFYDYVMEHTKLTHASMHTRNKQNAHNANFELCKLKALNISDAPIGIQQSLGAPSGNVFIQPLQAPIVSPVQGASMVWTEGGRKLARQTMYHFDVVDIFLNQNISFIASGGCNVVIYISNSRLYLIDEVICTDVSTTIVLFITKSKHAYSFGKNGRLLGINAIEMQPKSTYTKQSKRLWQTYSKQLSSTMSRLTPNFNPFSLDTKQKDQFLKLEISELFFRQDSND